MNISITAISLFICPYFHHFSFSSSRFFMFSLLLFYLSYHPAFSFFLSISLTSICIILLRTLLSFFLFILLFLFYYLVIAFYSPYHPPLFFISISFSAIRIFMAFILTLLCSFSLSHFFILHLFHSHLSSSITLYFHSFVCLMPRAIYTLKFARFFLLSLLFTSLLLLSPTRLLLNLVTFPRCLKYNLKWRSNLFFTQHFANDHSCLPLSVLHKPFVSSFFLACLFYGSSIFYNLRLLVFAVRLR